MNGKLKFYISNDILRDNIKMDLRVIGGGRGVWMEMA
jgi:DNA-binding cell septation regulator SpoVG